MTVWMVIRALMAPPALNILIVLVGLWCLRRRRLIWGRSLIALGLVSLWFLATPIGAGLLTQGLRPDPALLLSDTARWQKAGAIVVLGGGRDAAPEFGGQDMPNYWTASRLRYAAFLHRATGLPILVSGGRLLPRDIESEAAVMARSLSQDYRVKTRWQEGMSRTTWENAALSQQRLAEAGIHTVILVTQQLHMPRAKAAFEFKGMTVIAAPTDIAPPLAITLSAFLPRLTAFVRSQQALHEYGGLVWYAVKRLRG